MWFLPSSRLPRRAAEAIGTIVVSGSVCIGQLLKRFIVTCRDNFVYLTLGFFVVQIVDLRLVSIPEIFLAIHVPVLRLISDSPVKLLVGLRFSAKMTRKPRVRLRRAPAFD